MSEEGFLMIFIACFTTPIAAAVAIDLWARRTQRRLPRAERRRSHLGPVVKLPLQRPRRRATDRREDV
jgi:hypothetical protein